MADPQTLHATTVAIGGRALVLFGPSGSGKSALAIELIGRGAGLIADDRTILTVAGDDLIAACPPTLSGLIEARGLGILRSPPHPPCPVIAAVDMGTVESARFPPRRSTLLLDRRLPLLHKVDNPCFPAALWLYMTSGRAQP